jgi:hypothetical protein
MNCQQKTARYKVANKQKKTLHEKKIINNEKLMQAILETNKAKHINKRELQSKREKFQPSVAVKREPTFFAKTLLAP